MKPTRILIADDDREIVELISLYLNNEGFELRKAYDGRSCLQTLRGGDIDLLVLDVMMPGLDGIEVCRQLREEQNIPVIIVSAKTSPLDKVLGLATGADDYLAKPFHPMELVARIKAQLRRFTRFNPQNSGDREELAVKDLIIRPAAHQVLRGDAPLPLTPKEFGILLLLASHPRQVFSAEAIFERVWGEPAMQQDNTVMVHIRKLREKLGDDSRQPRYIRTVWGVGYRIEA